MCDRDKRLQQDSSFVTRAGLRQTAMSGTALVRACLLLTLAIALFTGCASVPKDYPRTLSTAFPDHVSTPIGTYFEKAARRPDLDEVERASGRAGALAVVGNEGRAN